MKKRAVDVQFSTTHRGSMADRLVTHMRRVMYKKFLTATEICQDDTLLDVGATSGDELEASNYLEAWYPYKDKITACGIDDAKFLEEKYPGMKYVHADGRTLPFEDNHFDVVHSSAVLEHVGSTEMQRRFVSELMRVAKRKVFLTTPNRWFPVEFHSALPFIHWLPESVFRKILHSVGHDVLCREENLHLLGPEDLRFICRTIGIKNFYIGYATLCAWPSNLLLTIDKMDGCG